MKPLEELGLVVGILAGLYTITRTGGGGGNTCNAPASNPSGTVQTVPVAGNAPTIPVPQLTNPFTSQLAQNPFPTFQAWVAPTVHRDPTTGKLILPVQ